MTQEKAQRVFDDADSAGMEDSLIACAEKFVATFKADSSASSLVSDVRYRINEERMAGVYDLNNDWTSSRTAK